MDFPCLPPGEVPHHAWRYLCVLSLCWWPAVVFDSTAQVQKPGVKPATREHLPEHLLLFYCPENLTTYTLTTLIRNENNDRLIQENCCQVFISPEEKNTPRCCNPLVAPSEWPPCCFKVDIPGQMRWVQGLLNSTDPLGSCEVSDSAWRYQEVVVTMYLALAITGLLGCVYVSWVVGEIVKLSVSGQVSETEACVYVCVGIQRWLDLIACKWDHSLL